MSTFVVTEGESEVITRLRRSVADIPDRIAITDGSASLSFSEVWERIRSLATYLHQNYRRENVDFIVPVLVDRGAESTIALLSCIYAGIPFAPLDGDLPIERLKHLINRLGSGDMVLSVPRYQGVKLDSSAQMVFSNREAESNSLLIDAAKVDANAKALVIFTSGSTGVPKGIVISWQGLAEKIVACKEYPESDNSSIKIIVHQPLHFLGGFHRSLTFCNGTLVNLIDVTELTHVDLLRRIRDLEITHLYLSPSIIRSLRYVPSNVDLFIPSVVQIRTGSEGILYEELHSVAGFFPEDLKIQHGFGSTEGVPNFDSVFTLKGSPSTGQVPLGRESTPGNMKLLPPIEKNSTSQEILFACEIAMEYLDDPSLTRERFITDAEGKRWWRSGDLVFRDEHGVFWHRGRIDDLVKIRGKLASPSEATRVLSSVKGIQSVVVLPHRISGSTRFVAHIVRSPNIELTARAVRRALALSLPAHLNPALLMLHSSLPLTRQGKIDRVALQASEIVAWRDSSIVEPRTASEFLVRNEALIVLDLDQISITDDLWEYGLDSLSAIELISRLSSAATHQLDLDDLLRFRTVAQIAKRISATFIPLFNDFIFNENGTEPTLFAIPGIGGHASHYVHLAAALGPNQKVHVLPEFSHDAQDLSIFTRSKMIAEAVNQSQPKSGISIMGYSGGGILALEVARILSDSGRKVNLLILDSGLSRSKAAFVAENLHNASLEMEPIALGLLRRKVSTFSRVFKQGGWRKGVADVWRIFHKQYLSYRYWAPIFWLSRKTYPKGITRYNFLAARKMRLRKGYVARPVNCELVFFSTKYNRAAPIWQLLSPHSKVVPIDGDHTTMIQPPMVLPLAEKIAHVISDFNLRTESAE